MRIEYVDWLLYGKRNFARRRRLFPLAFFYMFWLSGLVLLVLRIDVLCPIH